MIYDDIMPPSNVVSNGWIATHVFTVFFIMVLVAVMIVIIIKNKGG